VLMVLLRKYTFCLLSNHVFSDLPSIPTPTHMQHAHTHTHTLTHTLTHTHTHTRTHTHTHDTCAHDIYTHPHTYPPQKQQLLRLGVPSLFIAVALDEGPCVASLR